MILNKLLKTLHQRNFNNSFITSALQTRRVNTSEPNVIKSKVPNINIPDIFLEEYVWNGLHKWHDKVALVISFYCIGTCEIVFTLF